MNARSGEIEEGHGRLDVLRALRQQERPAPAYVMVSGKQWYVPVLWFDDDGATQHGYALAHNRSQERGGGYDDAKLYAALVEQAGSGMLEATGFDGDDLDTLALALREVGPEPIPALRSGVEVIVSELSPEQAETLVADLTARGWAARVRR